MHEPHDTKRFWSKWYRLMRSDYLNPICSANVPKTLVCNMLGMGLVAKTPQFFVVLSLFISGFLLSKYATNCRIFIFSQETKRKAYLCVVDLSQERGKLKDQLLALSTNSQSMKWLTNFYLAFLLLSCLDNTPTFSDAFLVEYRINSSSKYYKSIEDTYTSNRTYSDMKIRAGYLAICASSGDDNFCSARGNLTKLQIYPPINIYGSSNNTEEGKKESIAVLDPVLLAGIFSNEIVSPAILIFALFFNVLGFLCSLWPSGTTSTRSIIQTVGMTSIFLGWFFWTIGAVWFQVAGKATTSMVNQSSMTILKASVGGRALAMTWTAFSFLTISVALIILLKRKQAKEQNLAQAKECAWKLSTRTINS